MITDEQVETALRKWFKDEVTWDKGMAPWTADQFRVEMRATLEAALTSSAGEAEPKEQMTGEPKRWLLEEHLPGGTIRWYCFEHENQCRARGIISKHEVTVTPLFSSPSASEAQARVKALNWREEAIPPAGEILAGSPVGLYCIQLGRGTGYPLRFRDSLSLGDFKTIEEAKAAAQADYEQRIRSALVSASTPTHAELIRELVAAGERIDRHWKEGILSCRDDLEDIKVAFRSALTRAAEAGFGGEK